MKVPTALVFGASGQDGFYLSELLRRKQITVVGVSRSGGDLIGSVGGAAFVESLVKQHRPDYVFHLAATSSDRHGALFQNHESISTGTLNILEAVRTHSSGSRVFLCGSGLQFRNEGLPINETTEFAATSPYAVARIHSAYLGRYFRSAFGMNVYLGYLFNHDSPRRSAGFVNKVIVDAVSRIARGSSEKLAIGNLEVRKEFGFAGDTVEAIWHLVNQDSVHEAVIGTGEAHSLREWAQYCFGRIGRRLEDHVVVKEGFTPSYQTLVSNPCVIRGIGWAPAVGFGELADMMMEQS